MQKVSIFKPIFLITLWTWVSSEVSTGLKPMQPIPTQNEIQNLPFLIHVRLYPFGTEIEG